VWFFNLAIIVDFLTLCRATAAFFMLSLNIRDYNHSEIILYFSLLPSLLYTNAMGRLLISRAECRATSARRRTTAHLTVVSTVLRSGYLVNKTVSYVLMSVILVSMI
jgi:hypothetical protein